MAWRTIEDRLKGAGKAPSLKQLAEVIEHDFPDLVAIVYPANHPLGGWASTDRNIRGTRLRRPGKGRRGSRLIVSWRPGHEPVACPEAPAGQREHDYSGIGSHCRNCGKHRDGIVFEHNAAETYRTNQDVVRWIEDERRRRGIEATRDLDQTVDQLRGA